MKVIFPIKDFLKLTATEFLEKFDQLSLLSKEAFENDLLDKEAEKYGKKIQKVSISSLIIQRSANMQRHFNKDLGQWNNRIDPDLLDEGVQKILDRLLFIRVAEDRGIEPSTLIPLVRQAIGKNQKKPL